MRNKEVNEYLYTQQNRLFGILDILSQGVINPLALNSKETEIMDSYLNLILDFPEIAEYDDMEFKLLIVNLIANIHYENR